MTITKELRSLWDFDGWAYSKERLDEWKQYNPDFVAYLSSIVEEWQAEKGEPISETDLNDFLMFQADDIFDEWMKNREPAIKVKQD